MNTIFNSRLPTTLGLLIVSIITLWSVALPVTRAEAATKWFPGHYFKVLSDEPATWTRGETFLQNSETTGLQFQIAWKELEKAKGQYDFSKIDQMMTLAKKYGKRVNLKIEDRDFSGHLDGNMPAYMTQVGCVFYSKGGALKWWEPTCVDHLIDLYKALSQYDCDTTLASIIIGDGESALSGAAEQPGYTKTKNADQIIRAATEVKKLFPNTLTLTGFNWMPVNDLERIAATLEKIGGSGFVHPDTTPGSFMGDATAIEIEYKAKGVPTFANFQEPQLTSSDTNDVVLTWAVNTIGASMFGWNHYRKPDVPNYFPGLLTYLSTSGAKALATKNTACPSRLAPCVTTLSSCSAVYVPPPPPTICKNKLTSSTPIPTGFGASYNLFSTAKEYFVSSVCSGSTATVTVGNNDPLTYAYKTGYYHDGTNWLPYNLTCSGQTVSSVWCVGKGTTSVPLPQNPTSVIGYSCQWNGAKWNCGCSDSTCPQPPKWQLQQLGI